MASRLITLDEVLAEAASIIKDASEQEKAFMRQWIYRAQREIGFSNVDIKISEPLTLTDFSVKKPNDFLKTIDLALYTSDGREIRTSWKGWGKDKASLPEGSDARIHEDLRIEVQRIQVSEDLDYFHTESFAEGTDDTSYLIVKYYALPIDSQELPLIPESNTLAIMMYIKWMWEIRQNRNQAAIAQSRDVWLRERARASARNQTPSVLEGKQISRTINSMIQKAVIRDRQY